MDGNDFISFASRIAAFQTAGAACYRTAASRAYYGAFHLARTFLADLNYHCPGDKEHFWVQRHFLNCRLRAATTAGRLLADLHDSRKVADYRLDTAYADKQHHAIACVERAVEFQAQLAECRAPRNVEMVQLEMLDYRRRVNL